MTGMSSPARRLISADGDREQKYQRAEMSVAEGRDQRYQGLNKSIVDDRGQQPC
jgi:hypothetical protein